MEKHLKFAEILKQAGYSQTKSRKIIFDLLLSNKPLSLSELTRLSSKKVDRATVYRTLELFEKLGITQRVYAGWKYKVELTDKFQSHHHHFFCVNCQETFKLHHDQELENSIDSVITKNQFTAYSHSIEISGLCSNCQKLKSS